MARVDLKLGPPNKALQKQVLSRGVNGGTYSSHCHRNGALATCSNLVANPKTYTGQHTLKLPNLSQPVTIRTSTELVLTRDNNTLNTERLLLSLWGIIFLFVVSPSFILSCIRSFVCHFLHVSFLVPHGSSLPLCLDFSVSLLRLISFRPKTKRTRQARKTCKVWECGRRGIGGKRD